jgi:HD-GYP domain-containing protein (c-di-GMP phosphodiesterase class II)
MEMRRLSADQIRTNEPLPWDVFDEHQQLLLRKGYVIESQRQAEELVVRGVYVDVLAFAAKSGSFVPLVEEFNPFKLWDDIQRRLGPLIRQMLSTEATAETPGKMTELARMVQELSQKDADAGIAAMLLVESFKYPIAHPLHVAIVCELVTQRLNWSNDECLSTVAAAMTMNLGMMEMQNRLFHQQATLTEPQRQCIQEHPVKGYEILQQSGIQDQEWLTAVLEHHECPDGSGYPRAITDLSQTSQVIRLADIFCAKISPRSYRKPFLPNFAAREIFVSEGDGGQNPIATILIKEIGIYPPGSFVKLANGETAIVVRRGEAANSPVVAALSSGSGIPYVDPVERHTGRSKDFSITSALSRDKIMVQINMPRMWGYEKK